MTKKILVIGSGAREHAIVKSIIKSDKKPSVYCFSSSINPAIKNIVVDYFVGDILNVKNILDCVKSNEIETVIIGPEAPLEKGLADVLWDNNIATIGPKQKLAQLETSKGFTRQLLKDYNISGNPFFQKFTSIEGAKEVLKKLQDKYVIKADGLMGGKGVKVYGDHLFSLQDGLDYCNELINAGGEFVIEEKIIGQEFSLISFCDGENLIHMPIVQDHKRAFIGDKGPNTGGMGTYTDSNHRLPFISSDDIDKARKINENVALALKQKYNDDYKGILYGGFMATSDGIKLIEYNARFGDPEAMNLLTLLETDFVEIIDAIIDKKLDKVKVKFLNKATVCKYVVPNGYPDNPLKGELINIDNFSDNVPIFLGAVDMQDSNMIATGSRTLAIVGVADTIAQAEQIAQTEVEKIQGNFFHRKDIGTAELINIRIEHMNKLRGKNTYNKM